MSNKFFTSLLIAGAIATSPAFSQTAETQVLSDLHHSNQMEISMGKLAKKQGRSDAVKNFGDTMVKDHTAADKKVTEFAKTQHITLPDEKMPMGEAETKMTQHLQSLKGSAFDLAFAQAMVADHRQDIDKLQAAQSKLTGTPTADLVSSLLPIIQRHEQIASDLVSKLILNPNQKS